MKFILKLTKYLFLIIISIIIILIAIFIYYSQKLNFEIPKMVDVELYDQNEMQYLTLNNEEKKSYIALTEINQNIINCIISVEDKKFFKHKGIDILRIGGALSANIDAGDIRQGASTITQQYARMLYLSREQSLRRKAEEALIAMNIETKYNKEDILEGYLNLLYFDHGIYGIKDACAFYFNKLPSEVTLAEAAVLAAIPKGPSIYSPIKNPENNRTRQKLIINEVYKDGKINKDEAQKAINEKITFHGKIDKTNVYNAPFYQDVIVKELKALNIIDKFDVNELKVYTSLDLDLTSYLVDAFEKYYPKDSNIQYAAYAINPQNGDVLAIIGGNDYSESTFNRANDSLRQPGSTIKPFLYYTALSQGFTPITTFNSTKTEFHVNGSIYAPQNFADIYPNQDVTMAYAIATSDNIYAVKTHLFLGTDALYNTLKDFGFTTPILSTPSLALGTSEVKLSELTAGYGRFASLGKEVKPRHIQKITDKNNNVLYENNVKTTQKHNQVNAYVLTETMTNVFDNNFRINISATGAQISNMLTRKYAAKTGSTDYDAWIVGYNKDIVLGIWCGFDDGSVLNNADGKFVKYVWAEAIEKYMQGKDNSWYDVNEDIVKIKVNPIAGTLAKKGEYEKELYFDANNIPWYLFEKDDEKDNDEDEKDDEGFKFPDFPGYFYNDNEENNISH